MTLLAFLLVFGLVCTALGVLIERNRNLRADRDEWQEGFRRGAQKTTEHLFRTAVRATAVQGSPGSSARARRPMSVRAWAAVAKNRKLHEEPTVDLNRVDTVGLQRTGARFAGVAQLAEHRSCKSVAPGSSPGVGSTESPADTRR